MRDEAQRNVAPDDNGNGTSAAAYIDDAANAGKIDNLVLTYYPHVGSTFEDYEYWIDKLNVHNPNDRVFIVTPWSRGPEVSIYTTMILTVISCGQMMQQTQMETLLILNHTPRRNMYMKMKIAL